MKELNERQTNALRFMDPTSRSIVARSLTDGMNPDGSIKAYCLMCKQGSRQEINHCDDDLCPLRTNRPYQGTENNE